MTNSRSFLVIGSLIIGILFLGMIELMRLRFAAGDVYPPYSSLRTDPLGAKAFYESLQVCCGLNVQRNYEQFSRIQNRFDSTVLVLGFDSSLLRRFPKRIDEDVFYFISNGGRLIVSLLPATGEKEESLASALQGMDENTENFLDRWGVRSFYEKDRPGNAFLIAKDASAAGLPDSIQVHSALYFQTIHPDWRTLYERNHHPVVIERHLGRGSLVISAESYFFSNEALAKDRQPSLLLYIIGDRKTVLFDEYHHGVSAEAGVMVLARRYHLEWLLAGFILLALLFIWKNATPLVRASTEAATELQTGKESGAGLANLLRRNVPESELLSVCLDQWQKSSKEVSVERKNRMESIVEREEGKSSRHRDLSAAYNALHRALKERRS
jgi:uncharacterized protein DUF4350